MRLAIRNAKKQVIDSVVGWVILGRRDRCVTQSADRDITRALKMRDERGTIAFLERHIERRYEEIRNSIREGFNQIYIAVSSDCSVCSMESYIGRVVRTGMGFFKMSCY